MSKVESSLQENALNSTEQIMHGLDLIPSFKEDLGRKTRSLSSSAEF